MKKIQEIWLELSANNASEFLNQLYFKSKGVNQHDFLYGEIDGMKIRGDLKIFSWLSSKILTVNQIAEFLTQSCLK